MEEKRFVSFLILSLAIMTSYIALHSWLFPPPPRAKPPKAAEQVERPEQGKGAGKQPAEKKQAVAKAEEKPAAPTPQEAQQGEAGKKPAAADRWQPPQHGRLVSLGSLAADSPYRFLAILDSRGASIKWIELNERTRSGRFRYRELEDKSGYLGHLALSDGEDGWRVNVVGAGTPAALAKPLESAAPVGLRPGDRIEQVDGKPVAQLAGLAGDVPSADMALRQYLRGKRPGEMLTLTVQRPSAGRLTYQAQLTVFPLQLVQPEWTDGVQHPQSLLLSLGLWENDKFREIDEAMRTANWETKLLHGDGGPGVQFRFILDAATMEQVGGSGAFEIIKRYRLVPTPPKERNNPAYKSYHLTLEIEIRNTGDQPQAVCYQLDGPTGLPTEGWWYSYKVIPSWGGAGARDVLWASQGRHNQLVWGCPTIFKNALKGEPTELFEPPPVGLPPQRTLRHVGGDTKYFAVVLKPDDGQPAARYIYVRGEARPVMPVHKEDRRQAKKTDTSFRLISQPHELEPDEVFAQRFIVFAGPKQPDLLAQYQLEELTYYGWFGFVSRPLVAILHLFEMLPLVNYGLAIILLTVLVRAAMTPVSRKAARNAQMMQLLQPEMKKIAEKYKNDMEKRGRAQQELFRKYNYNPFSGCLVMFLQLPIFIGLYRALAVDIALRDQPLISGLGWCTDLTAPDRLWYWASVLPAFLTSPTGWLGPYLNLLPIATVVLFIVQQKMFAPPPTDEQQRLTQKMMSFMTLFIGLMFFKVPSGLCVYFVTSSLWGIAERQLLPKPTLPEHLRPPGHDGGEKTKRPAGGRPGPNGASRSQKSKSKRKRSKGKR